MQFFLDLKKAFELANRDAILSLLASRGISGRLLGWLQDYLTDRQAKVRFQSQLSDLYTLENCIPQGGLLSPYLFNILIAKLMDITFPDKVQLLAYADDIQLVATGPHRYVDAQSALGLKVNPNKSKALQIKCLGIHFNSVLSATTQCYLYDRTKYRLNSTPKAYI